MTQIDSKQLGRINIVSSQYPQAWARIDAALGQDTRKLAGERRWRACPQLLPWLAPPVMNRTSASSRRGLLARSGAQIKRQEFKTFVEAVNTIVVFFGVGSPITS